jgi:hypothetical protein
MELCIFQAIKGRTFHLITALALDVKDFAVAHWHVLAAGYAEGNVGHLVKHLAHA